MLTAVALLSVNSSTLPARWAEKALTAAFPGVHVDVGNVRFTGLGSLEATALRLDVDNDGQTDFRSDKVSIAFSLLRWLQERDALSALDAVIVRGVHARILLPQGEAAATLVGGVARSARPASDPGPPGPQDWIARLPQGVHVRLHEAEVTLADGSGELTRLTGEAEVVRAEVAGRNTLQLSLAVEEASGATFGADVKAPLDPAGPWEGELHLAGDLSAPWVPRLLERIDGWPAGMRLAGPVGLEGTLSGLGTRPNIRLEIQGAPVSVETGWNRYRFDRAAGQLAWDSGGLQLESLELHDGPAVVRAFGGLSATGPQLHVQGERLPLEGYLPFLKGYLEGEGSLEGQVSGPWSDLACEGTVIAQKPVLLGGEVERLEAQFLWAQGALQVNRAQAEAGGGTLVGRGSWRPGEDGGEILADVQSDAFALQTLPAVRKLGLGGRLDGEVHLEGPVQALALSGQAASSRLLVGPARFDHLESRFAGTWDRLRVEELTARREDGGTYQVSGWVGPGVTGARAGEGPGLDLEVAVRDESLPELAALLGYKIPSYLLTGRFDGRAVVTGSSANPSGSARLELREAPILGKELVTQMDLRFGDGSVRVEQLRRHPLRTGLNSWTPS